MKKFATLLVLLSVLFSFSACGSDDDDDIDQASLVGTWRVERATLDKISSNNNTYDKLLKKAIKSADYSTSGLAITFKENGTFEMPEATEGSQFGTYTIQGNKIIIIAEKEDGILYYKKGRLVLTETASQDEMDDVMEQLEGILPSNYQIYSMTMTMYFKK